MAQEEGGVLDREEIDEGLEDANELDMKRRICQIQDQYHNDSFRFSIAVVEDRCLRRLLTDLECFSEVDPLWIEAI